VSDAPIDEEDTGPRESIADLCDQLAQDARFLARAEIARVRAIVFRRIVKGRLAIFFAATSALLAQSAVLVLLVGLMLYLRIHLGIIGATLVSMAVALIFSGLFAWLALQRVKHALRKEDDLL
jgi:hypothetical protein